jgi:hypothetical protein
MFKSRILAATAARLSDTESEHSESHQGLGAREKDFFGTNRGTGGVIDS